MPSALSITDIANMALDYLEEAPLQSIDDDRSVARWMKRNFWPIAWGLMRAHPWNFAITRASLTAAGTAPAFGWLYSYAMPSDSLRLLPVTCSGYEDADPIKHKVEGSSILTNQAAPLKIRYIKRIDNTGLFDNNFCDALAIALAQKAAHFVTGKQSYAQTLQPILANAIAEAQRVDSLEGTPEEPLADEWLLARWA